MNDQIVSRKWKTLVRGARGLAPFELHSEHETRVDALSHAASSQETIRDVARIEGPDGEAVSLPEIRQWYLDWMVRP
jgi:hypothetical protein